MEVTWCDETSFTFILLFCLSFKLSQCDHTVSIGVDEREDVEEESLAVILPLMTGEPLTNVLQPRTVHPMLALRTSQAGRHILQRNHVVVVHIKKVKSLFYNGLNEANIEQTFQSGLRHVDPPVLVPVEPVKDAPHDHRHLLVDKLNHRDFAIAIGVEVRDEEPRDCLIL